MKRGLKPSGLPVSTCPAETEWIPYFFIELESAVVWWMGVTSAAGTSPDDSRHPSASPTR